MTREYAVEKKKLLLRTKYAPANVVRINCQLNDDDSRAGHNAFESFSIDTGNTSRNKLCSASERNACGGLGFVQPKAVRRRNSFLANRNSKLAFAVHTSRVSARMAVCLDRSPWPVEGFFEFKRELLQSTNGAAAGRSRRFS